MIKTKRLKGKEITIASITHLPTEDDKNLGEVLEGSDVIGVEKELTDLDSFVGKRGKEIIEKRSKPVVKLNLTKPSCLKERYYFFKKDRESKIFPFLLESFILLPFLPISFYDELAYQGNYKEAYRNEKIYRKLADACGELVSLAYFPFYTVKDVGMGYAIKALAEEYDSVLAVVGKAHFYPLLRFLDEPEKLEKQFRRFSYCFKNRLEVREPSRNYKVVRKIPLKKFK